MTNNSINKINSMNHHTKISLFVMITSTLILCACEKGGSPPLPLPEIMITYPDSGYYGKSVLSLEDSTLIDGAKDFGFTAVLQKFANVSIKITDLSPIDSSTGHIPKWSYTNNPIGWMATTWNSGTQEFTATQTGKLDMQITFHAQGQPGTCRLDFYENSSTITKTKYLILK